MRRLIVGVFLFYAFLPPGFAQQAGTVTQASTCPNVNSYANPNASSQSGTPASPSMQSCQQMANIANCYLQTDPATRTSNDFNSILPTTQANSGLYTSAPSPSEALGDLVAGQVANQSSPDTPPGAFLATWTRQNQDQATINAINNCISNNNSLCFVDSPNNYANPSSPTGCACTCSTPHTASDSSASQPFVDANANVALNQIKAAPNAYKKSYDPGQMAVDNGTPCMVVKELFTTPSCQAALTASGQSQGCSGQTSTTANETVTGASQVTNTGADTQCQTAGQQGPGGPGNQQTVVPGSAD